MKTLIKKDIRTVGPLLNICLILLALIYTILIKLVDDTYLSFFVYIGILLYMLHLVNSTIWDNDYQYKIDNILNSLPIARKTIVASRYMTMMIYILSLSSLVFIMSFIFDIDSDNIFMNSITLNEILNIISAVILLMAGYLAIYYYTAYKERRASDLLLFIAMVYIVIFRYSYIKENIIYRVISNIDFKGSPYILLIISIIAYLASLHFSVKIYSKRQL